MSAPGSRQQTMLRLRTWVLAVTGVLTFAGFIAFLVQHWDYYTLSLAERPFHTEHGALHPSGRTGLWSGMVATTLFILNLGYLIRKRLLHITFLGPLRMWMDVHVLTGLGGAGLIIFHSALAPSSALGSMALVALLITVFTGIAGRTIYIQVPRSLEGRELEFSQVRQELHNCRTELEMAGVQSDWLDQPLPKPRTYQSSIISSLIVMIKGYRERERAYRALKRQILSSTQLKGTAHRILPLARNFCIHTQWFIHYHELRSLIASWRFFHRWLAILMLCVVLCHVLMALHFGNLHPLGGAQ